MTSDKSAKEELLKRELQVLFQALCDGLRQEVRQRRSLTHLIPGQDFSLTREREVGIASSLAWHLRLAGFIVQVDAYFACGDPMRRPDFGIWLPASQEYIYLELKMTAWGRDWSYRFQGALGDIKKLNEDAVRNRENQRNGLIALGLSRRKELRVRLEERFTEFSHDITKDYPHYEVIGLKRVNLEGMDEQSSYAVIGLWFRKFS